MLVQTRMLKKLRTALLAVVIALAVCESAAPFYVYSGYGYTQDGERVGSIGSYSNDHGYGLKTFPGTQGMSFMINDPDHPSAFFVVDENYGSSGSSVFRFHLSKDGEPRMLDSTSHASCLGAVFILSFGERIYSPCFGSNNLWVLERSNLQTAQLVDLKGCLNPHGVYEDNGIFYVPCRDSDNIALYTYDPNQGDLVPNDPAFVDLQEVTAGQYDQIGPRHIAFVDDFYYVINEYSCEVYKMELGTNMLLAQAKLFVGSEPSSDMTGAEIRYSSTYDCLLASLRVAGQNGSVIQFSKDFVAVNRTDVGITPRFFDFMPNVEHLLVLNQDGDGKDLTVIDIGTLASLSPQNSDLRMHPQCCVFLSE